MWFLSTPESISRDVCCSKFDCVALVTKNNKAVETEGLVILLLA